jgi:hypothetical protein
MCSVCVRRVRDDNGRMIMLCNECARKLISLKTAPTPTTPLPQRKKSIFGFLRGNSSPPPRREKTSK